MCKIILNLCQKFGRRCHLRVFYYYFNSGGHLVWWSGTIRVIDPTLYLFFFIGLEFRKNVIYRLFSYGWSFCSVELNRLDNFGRGFYEENLVKTILKLGKEFRKGVV